MSEHFITRLCKIAYFRQKFFITTSTCNIDVIDSHSNPFHRKNGTKATCHSNDRVYWSSLVVLPLGVQNWAVNMGSQCKSFLLNKSHLNEAISVDVTPDTFFPPPNVCFNTSTDERIMANKLTSKYTVSR
jgi:hypothetical protein